MERIMEVSKPLLVRLRVDTRSASHANPSITESSRAITRLDEQPFYEVGCFDAPC